MALGLWVPAFASPSRGRQRRGLGTQTESERDAQVSIFNCQTAKGIGEGKRGDASRSRAEWPVPFSLPSKRGVWRGEARRMSLNERDSATLHHAFKQIKNELHKCGT